MYSTHKILSLPSTDQALPGRTEPMLIEDPHFVLTTALTPPYPPHCQSVLLGMGCFWGTERLFWRQPGVYTTAVGYAGGITPNPTYREVCTGMTGHSEVVLVVYDPQHLDFNRLLQLFWESHNPTQGMRQGNDIGTQYRSCLYPFDQQQLSLALASREHYQSSLHKAGLSDITTQIALAPAFYYAEPEHQQYLAKHPDGYCGLRGSGVPLIQP